LHLIGYWLKTPNIFDRLLLLRLDACITGKSFLADLFTFVAADVFVTKRIKSTQQELAQKDLEMLEQYVAKQRAENTQAAGEFSEQAILEHARKVVETSAEEAGPSSASEQKGTRKVAGRSAMDQVQLKHS